MSGVLIVNAVIIFGLLLGVRLFGRRRFNAGVAVGRRAERLEHGWHDDPHLRARIPQPRRWRVLNRQHVNEQLVFRVVTPSASAPPNH